MSHGGNTVVSETSAARKAACGALLAQFGLEMHTCELHIGYDAESIEPFRFYVDGQMSNAWTPGAVRIAYRNCINAPPRMVWHTQTRIYHRIGRPMETLCVFYIDQDGYKYKHLIDVESVCALAARNISNQPIFTCE